MNTTKIRIIREYASQGRIRLKKHALIRMIERNIRIAEVEEALQRCNIIASYPEDQPLTSCLLLGFTNNKRPLHIVVAIDELGKYIWIITVYEPDKNKWDETFSKRRTK